MKLASLESSRRGKRVCGMSLTEVLVGLALSTILVAMGGSLWLFGSRSFAAISNYTDLDIKSRNALDQMSRDIRQATQVTAFQSSASSARITLADAAGATITYTWSAGPRTLVCQKTGQPDRVYLTECDSWIFQFFQRAPQKNGSYVFYPATNSVGAYDLSICKLINMSWKCSRTILGTKANSEIVQTAQVVLRNKQ
jgi:Tfp pilus assembly protein PilW